MVTLREAFNLCRVDDDEVIYLCDSVENVTMRCIPVTGKEVRGKYDMRNTIVTSIVPHFCVGEYVGFTFIIKDLAEKQEVPRSERLF